HNGVSGLIGPAAPLSTGSSTLSRSNTTVAIIFAPSFGIASQMGADKYIFNPSIRPELNSAYGSKMKVTINPSFGFKWNFYAENFMENMDFLNYGAIRTTWGRVVR